MEIIHDSQITNDVLPEILQVWVTGTGNQTDLMVDDKQNLLILLAKLVNLINQEKFQVAVIKRIIYYSHS